MVSGWALTSASVDFSSRGVAAGMVVQLTGPRSAYNPADALAVASVSANTLTLRRIGLNGSGGDPPAAAAAVEFTILSLKPQIENAAFELNESYSLDPNVAYRTPSDVYDIRIFRRLTALWVVSQLYLNENRAAGGDFAAKAVSYRQQYDDALGKAIVRWGPKGTSQPPTTRAGGRIGR